MRVRAGYLGEMELHYGCRYELDTPCAEKGDFHLTVTRAVVVLRSMSTVPTERKEETAKTSCWRWLPELTWRKVATVAGAVVALGMGYHVVFGHNGLTVYQQKREESRSLTEQLQGLQRENERLKGHVDRLQDDPNAIEHQAREELHYTRPGEVIYTMPEATSPAKPH
jgi:cell division protein FtsB